MPCSLSRILGHGVRICKILRAEWQRQARLHRDSLYLQLHHLDRPSTAKKKWRELCVLIDRATEFLWQRMLTTLRDSTPKKPPQPSNRVHIVGEIALPEEVNQILGLGPKFAVEPRKTPHELLTLVRQVAQRMPEDESNRCVSEEEWDSTLQNAELLPQLPLFTVTGQRFLPLSCEPIGAVKLGVTPPPTGSACYVALKE
ncbi:hypothetical protein HPB52_022710 [Rhipicephalus sanguineus]|uniref:Uncharacterized protein n=1 Tax=Rhipicephalus sanguineus TaxID=34632 RepID=A0A9D4Q603_RHISA|nr:hypothetical protein HPB52_022710 [Rhipicephalus sanguineus]